MSNSVVYSVLAIPWDEQSVRRIDMLERAMDVLGQGIVEANTAYIDFEAVETGGSEYCGLVIPCRSIWGMRGIERLAAVLMFETSC